jgi:hypothetical protein
LTTDGLFRRLPPSGKARRDDEARSDGPGSDGVAPWRRRPNLWLVGALTALAALGYSGFSLVMRKPGIKG